MVKHEKSKERLECLRENYKIVLQKLWKKRDLETLLFLRVAYETGIRGNDILKMDMSCMKGRQILLAEGKRGLETVEWQNCLSVDRDIIHLKAGTRHLYV